MRLFQAPAAPARKRFAGILAVGLLLGAGGCKWNGAGAEGVQADAAPLIPRQMLFGPPERESIRISPDGRSIAFLSPRNGRANVWIAPAASPSQARLLTDERGGDPLVWLAWSAGGRYLLAAQETMSGQRRFFSIEAASGLSRPLAPADAAEQAFVGQSARDPGFALLSWRLGEAGAGAVYRVDLRTGEASPVFGNAQGFERVWADRRNEVRLGAQRLADGQVEFWTRPDGEAAWSLLFTAPFEDALLVAPLGFDDSGRSILMLDSTGRDRAALVRVEVASGQKTVIGESKRADVSDVWLSETSLEPQAYGAQYLKPDLQPLSADAKAALEYLRDKLNGELEVVSRSRDDMRWVLIEHSPTTAPRAYLFDRRDGQSLRLLFSLNPQLASQPLQPMTPVEIGARDGLTLVSYLTLPAGADTDGDSRPDQPVPLVLIAHDGPWRREGYGFDVLHQWLANRGYAALTVNFRGSSGFGKAFVNAGNREWGGAMQQDLLDALDWAVAERIAPPERIAILGRGYGGYAAVMALAMHADLFACGVAAGAPLDLEPLIASLARRGAQSGLDLASLRIGEARTPAGRAFLRERSPLRRAGAITDPLLLVQGSEEPGAMREATAAFVAALQARDAPLTYATLAGGGEGFRAPADRLAYFALAEVFLAQCLGGRAEPLGGALEAGSLRLLAGAERLPALAEARPAQGRKPGLSP